MASLSERLQTKTEIRMVFAARTEGVQKNKKQTPPPPQKKTKKKKNTHPSKRTYVQIPENTTRDNTIEIYMRL